MRFRSRVIVSRIVFRLPAKIRSLNCKVMGITRPTHQHAWQTVVCFVISYLVSIVVVNGIGGDKVSTDGKSYYTEDLTLQQLGQRHVAARFVFRSTWTPKDRHRCQEHEDWPRDETTQTQESSYSVGKLCHFEAVFPRAMGVLLDRFEVSLSCNHTWLCCPVC